MELTLERRSQGDETGAVSASSGGATMLITPPIDESYWEYRVQITPKQAVVGFPKFTTIGIGFQHEEDWNTNLPYLSKTPEIVEHIWHNRGDSIPDDAEHWELVAQAIELIKDAAHAERGTSREQEF